MTRKSRFEPTRSLLPVLGVVLSWGALTVQGRAQILDLTAQGSAIEGVDYSGDYSQLGTSHFHAGDQGSLTDGTTASPNLGSQSDTFVDTGANYTTVNGISQLDDSSYIGFTFASPTSQYVTGMTVNFNLFSDGGWFGVHNTTGTSPLAPVLIEPTVQVTTNGTTWTTVLDTSTYKAVVGLDSPGSGATVQVNFELTDPVSGIEGIRVTGLSGGTAGQQMGFIGVADERVFGADSIPEPTTYALMLAGLLSIFGFARLRHCVVRG
jgi:hypothetical protein